ncbi:hypothetical protein TorRG33x02_308730 [Trema orientale]|uniref:Uncharacterized protein n=1 Tax=Trema orientale TaxID=63057 RepID=A0A2P5BU83_TREOI|nr:hypothetical protein TorRG33x02_308730 [Trema orientale]
MIDCPAAEQLVAAAFGGLSLDNVRIAEALAIRNEVSVAKSALVFGSWELEQNSLVVVNLLKEGTCNETELGLILMDVSLLCPLQIVKGNRMVPIRLLISFGLLAISDATKELYGPNPFPTTLNPQFTSPPRTHNPKENATFQRSSGRVRHGLWLSDFVIKIMKIEEGDHLTVTAQHRIRASRTLRRVQRAWRMRGGPIQIRVCKLQKKGGSQCSL